MRIGELRFGEIKYSNEREGGFMMLPVFVRVVWVDDNLWKGEYKSIFRKMMYSVWDILNFQEKLKRKCPVGLWVQSFGEWLGWKKLV